MNVHQILEELAYDTGELPREALEAAILKREEMIPYLLQILEETILRIDEIVENDDYQGHLFALYLLAQFREKRALPLTIALISFPGDIPHILLGDIITEDLPRILASFSFHDIEPLKEIIENTAIDEYVRSAALRSLVTLVGCGFKRRSEILYYYKSLFYGKLERRSSFVWDSLILSITELYPDEFKSEIALAFDEDLIDQRFITRDEIEKVLASSKEKHLFQLYQNAELIEDTVTEMEKWLTPTLN